MKAANFTYNNISRIQEYKLQTGYKMCNTPEKELCLNTLFGVLGLPRLVWPATGLLLSLDTLPCWGEVKPSGSRQESLSSSEEQSASPEVTEDTLIRSQFTSCRKGGGRKKIVEAV